MSEPDEADELLSTLDPAEERLVRWDMLIFGIGFIDRETGKRVPAQSVRLPNDGVYTLKQEEST